MFVFMLGTRVYVYLSEDWKNNNVSGLCGNYDGKAMNDFCIDGACETMASAFAERQVSVACPATPQDDNYDPCLVRHAFF